MSETFQVRQPLAVEETRPPFGFSIPPLLSLSSVIEVRVAGDYPVDADGWPVRLGQAGNSFMLDLSKFRWSPGDTASFTQVGTQPTGLFVGYTMGAMHPLSPLFFEQVTVGDPAAVHQLINQLGPVRNIYPKAKEYPGLPSNNVLFLEPYRIVKSIIERSARLRVPTHLRKDSRCVLLEKHILDRVRIVEILRLVWVLGWLFPELPLVVEYKKQEYVIASTGGAFGVGQTFKEETTPLREALT